MVPMPFINHLTPEMTMNLVFAAGAFYVFMTVLIMAVILSKPEPVRVPVEPPVRRDQESAFDRCSRRN